MGSLDERAGTPSHYAPTVNEGPSSRTPARAEIPSRSAAAHGSTSATELHRFYPPESATPDFSESEIASLEASSFQDSQLDMVEGLLRPTVRVKPLAEPEPIKRPQPPAMAKPVITSTSSPQLAKLAYLSGANEVLAAEWRHMFCVMRKDDGSYVLLVEMEASGRAVLRQIESRLVSVGFAIADTLRVTAEVIEKIHASNAGTGRGPSGLKPAVESDTVVEKQVRQLANDAVAAGASDIHIESRVTHADIFLRIHGQRVLLNTISYEQARSMCSVMATVMADASSKPTSWDMDSVIDTAFEHKTPEGLKVQLRFSSAPIHPAGNFQAVLRVLIMDPKRSKKLEDLGYYDEQIEAINRMLIGSTGMVLVTGPTNSGKSTAMQALIGQIYARRGLGIKVITVEDPVEYIIPHATQMGVPRTKTSVKAENDSSVFTTYLRGTLRQDPDVVMVGEIRDIDGAEVTRDLVLAGRKVATTLHTYSALWTFTRLHMLKVPMELLTMPGFISGIIYQRLLPRLCVKCSIPLMEGGLDRIEPDVYERLKKVVYVDEHNIRVRGLGCSHCNNTGVTGMVPIVELLTPDAELLRLMANHDTPGVYRYWAKHGGVPVPEGPGGVSVLAHALARMCKGEVAPNDIESYVTALDSDLIALGDTNKEPSYLEDYLSRDTGLTAGRPRSRAQSVLTDTRAPGGALSSAHPSHKE